MTPTLWREILNGEGAGTAQRYEYKVETIRSSLVGDKIDPGGTEGLLAVFERPT